MKEELIKQWKEYDDYLDQKFNGRWHEIDDYKTFNHFMCWLEHGFIHE